MTSPTRVWRSGSRLRPALAATLGALALAGCSVEPTGRSVGSSGPLAAAPSATTDVAEEDEPAADLPGTPRYAAGGGVDLGVVPGSRSRAAGVLEASRRTLQREHTGYFHVTAPDGTTEGLRDGKWDLDAERASFDMALPGRVYSFLATASQMWAGLARPSNGADRPSCWIHAPLAETVTPLPEVVLALSAEPVGVSRVDPDTVVARVPIAAAISVALPGVYGGGEPTRDDFARSTTVLVSVKEGVVDAIAIPVRDTIDAFGVKRLPAALRDVLEPSMGEVTVAYTDIGATVVIEPPAPPTEVLEADSLEDLTYADADCERMRPATG